MPNSKKTALNHPCLTVRILIGNTLEHYDTALFGFLAPFIAGQFFGPSDPLFTLIKAYAIIPLGIIAKPIGSFVFGWIGDSVGHKKSLSLSLYGMALCSLLICLIPSYQTIGALSAYLLASCRLIQGFFAAGELSGGAVCLLDAKSLEKHQVLSTLYSSSTILGIILASAATAFLAWQGDVEQNWRTLYLIGTATGIVGAFIPIEKTPVKNRALVPIKEHLKGLRRHTRQFLWIATASGFSYSSYSMAFIASHALLPFITTISSESCASMNCALLVLDLFLFPLFASFAKYLDSFNTMKTAAVASSVLGVFLFTYLSQTSLVQVFCLRFVIVFLGVAFSAYFHAWSLQIAPSSLKQTTISLAYSLGSQALGAPTALLTLFLYQTTNSLLIASLYWVFLGFLASYCVHKSQESILGAKKAFS